MPKVIANEAGWKELMESSQEKPVVVDFYADWCGPCKVIGPVFVAMSEADADVHFAKVDVDNEEMEETVGAQGVQAMPTFIAYFKGAKVDTLMGASEEGLKKLVATAKAAAAAAAAAPAAEASTAAAGATGTA